MKASPMSRTKTERAVSPVSENSVGDGTGKDIFILKLKKKAAAFSPESLVYDMDLKALPNEPTASN